MGWIRFDETRGLVGGGRPRVAEVLACVSYALNLLDPDGWLSGVPEERPLSIRISSR